MEIHQLRYFVAAVESGSFTRAAADCAVSQPSLSQAIQKLEQELRHPLFERLGRRIQLTREGRSLYQRAVRILGDLDGARGSIVESDAMSRGRISVGAIPTIAPYFLPPVIQQFSRKYPEAEIRVFEDVTDHMLKRCHAGEVDVALVSLPIAEEHLHVETLFREELFVCLPKGHALTHRRAIPLDQVTSEPFILLGEAHCLGDQVLSFCRQSECLPAVSCHSAQLLTVMELVALGRGISLIPAMAKERDASKAREYRSIRDRPPSRVIAMAWHKNRFQPPVVRAFVELVRTYASLNPPVARG